MAYERTVIESAGHSLPKIRDVKVIRLLGQGGMGSVYLGQQTYLNRKVAIKTVLHSGCDMDFASRFQREARSLATLTHENIVSCHDAGTLTDGSCYMLMEYVDGPNLREWIDDNGRVPIQNAIGVIRKMAEALQHAHEAGFIHRDIKPANILLQCDPKAEKGDDFPFVPKLADLGLVRSVDPSCDDDPQLTAPGAIMGTPLCMAPEQFDDPDTVDHRADIYGLGCVLFHCLTAQAAFRSEHPTAVLRQKCLPNPPDPRDVSEDIPTDAAELVTRMLRFEAKDRPQTYAELIQICDQICPPADATSAPLPRTRTWLAVSGFLLAALAVLTFLLLNSDNSPLKAPDLGLEDVGIWINNQPVAEAYDFTAREEDAIRVSAETLREEYPESTFAWSIAPAGGIELEGETTPTVSFRTPNDKENYKVKLSLLHCRQPNDEPSPLDISFVIHATDDVPVAKIGNVADDLAEGDALVLKSESLDAEEEHLEHAWTIRKAGEEKAIHKSGAEVELTLPAGAEPYELTIELESKDPSGQSGTSTITRTVAAVDDPPKFTVEVNGVAYVGEPIPVQAGRSFTVDAGRCEDDGGCKFHWTFGTQAFESPETVQKFEVPPCRKPTDFECILGLGGETYSIKIRALPLLFDTESIELQDLINNESHKFLEHWFTYGSWSWDPEDYSVKGMNASAFEKALAILRLPSEQESWHISGSIAPVKINHPITDEYESGIFLLHANKAFAISLRHSNDTFDVYQETWDFTGKAIDEATWTMDPDESRRKVAKFLNDLTGSWKREESARVGTELALDEDAPLPFAVSFESRKDGGAYELKLAGENHIVPIENGLPLYFVLFVAKNSDVRFYELEFGR